MTLTCLGTTVHQASKTEDKGKKAGADTNPGSQKPSKVRQIQTNPKSSALACPGLPLSFCSQLSAQLSSEATPRGGGIIHPAIILSDPESRKWCCAAQVKGSVDDIFGVETDKQRKRTEEGYTIYHEDELGMNKGGETELCPFDCKCCF